jgi:hypothetical protein
LPAYRCIPAKRVCFDSNLLPWDLVLVVFSWCWQILFLLGQRCRNIRPSTNKSYTHMLYKEDPLSSYVVKDILAGSDISLKVPVAKPFGAVNSAVSSRCSQDSDKKIPPYRFSEPHTIFSSSLSPLTETSTTINLPSIPSPSWQSYLL